MLGQIQGTEFLFWDWDIGCQRYYKFHLRYGLKLSFDFGSWLRESSSDQCRTVAKQLPKVKVKHNAPKRGYTGLQILSITGLANGLSSEKLLFSRQQHRFLLRAKQWRPKWLVFLIKECAFDDDVYGSCQKFHSKHFYELRWKTLTTLAQSASLLLYLRNVDNLNLVSFPWVSLSIEWILHSLYSAARISSLVPSTKLFVTKKAHSTICTWLKALTSPTRGEKMLMALSF